MPAEAHEGIEAAAIDMWEPYINAVKRGCPHADIVFDLFHVRYTQNLTLPPFCQAQIFRRSE